MEALIVVNFLNNYQYWRLRYNLEPTHPNIAIQKNPKTYVVPPLKEGKTNKGWSMTTIIWKGNKAEKVIYYHAEEWDTMYSKSDAGSTSVSGRWTKEGKLLFISWVKRIGAARNHEGTRAMQDLIWRALQADYSIQADNPEVVENQVARRLLDKNLRQILTGMLLLVSTYLVVVTQPMILPILLLTKCRRVTIQALMSTSRTIVIIVAALKKTNTHLKVMKTKMHKF
jgi:hypothetical protein